MKKTAAFLTMIFMILLAGCEVQVNTDDKTVTVNEYEKTKVTSFIFYSNNNPALGRDVAGKINNNTITLTVPYGTAITGLVPTIVTGGGTPSITPGSPKNFRDPVEFSVSSKSGDIEFYTVFVAYESIATCEITSFTLPGIDAAILIDGLKIHVAVPPDAGFSLTPHIIYTGTKISPASDATMDFSRPVQYTVTAGDGSTRQYTVYVEDKSNSTKDIISFTFNNPAAEGNINGTNISVNIPQGKGGFLVPTIAHTGESIQPASGIMQDFRQPVSYSVTDRNGSIKIYTVTVKEIADGSKKITSFAFLKADNPDLRLLLDNTTDRINGIIDQETLQISVKVPYSTQLQNLIPTIEHSGSSMVPDTGVVQNFEKDVIYTVFAPDKTTNNYIVHVDIDMSTAPSTDKNIISFAFNKDNPENDGLGIDVSGRIDAAIVKVVVPHTMTDKELQSLAPSIKLSCSKMDGCDNRVYPPSGAVQNFTKSVNYTVTAEDGTSRFYTVIVKRIAIESFCIYADDNPYSWLKEDVTGNIFDNFIDIILPDAADPSFIRPRVEYIGDSITPEQKDICNFNSPVTYTVRTTDGVSRSYSVIAH